MLKEVLGSIEGGSRSVVMISRELGMEEDRVKEVIQQLIRMGYVEIIDDPASCITASCKGCPIYRDCRGNKDGSPRLVLYSLTDKGRRQSK